MGFINDYFLNPIRIEQGYNFFNTVTYALIAFAALWALNKLFRKSKTKIDVKFLFQLLPFIVIGSFLRVLVDKREIPRAAWNVSPGIYLSVAFAFILSFFFAYLLQRKANIQIWKTVTVIGVSIFIGLLASTLPLKFINLRLSAFIVALAVLLVLSFNLIFERINWNWARKPLPFLAFSTQLFDATVTVFLVQFFGAIEKHPLPRLIMTFFNSGFAFYPLKISVVLLALYYINKEVKDKSFRNLLIISIAVLGLAQGLRNLLGFIVF